MRASGSVHAVVGSFVACYAAGFCVFRLLFMTQHGTLLVASTSSCGVRATYQFAIGASGVLCSDCNIVPRQSFDSSGAL